MLATECSKPHMTKKVTGKTQARSFPGVDLAPKAIKTARQTRILQSAPRMMAGPISREIFARAMLAKVSPKIPEFALKMPLKATKSARKRLPSKFPK